mgnify:FL=1|jgi:hypothetical protein|tara:strand:+ start:3989 stop:4429 length:441 start_codon:yes stop_codon:yes gene_type:complete
MLVDEIAEMWIKDAVIDDVELDTESLKVPTLHAKYLKILYQEKLKLKSFTLKRKTVSRVLGEYYRGDLNSPEDLRELQREPWSRTVLKQDLSNYVDSDKDMIKLLTKISYQEEVVSLLEDIIKNINNRGFQIKNSIDWRKLTNFGL